MKYLIIAIVLLTSSCAFASDKIIDSLGYRFYHDVDNEREGSKLRMYVGKKFYNSKVKFAYERKRTGRGIEAGTMFIDQSFKF